MDNKEEQCQQSVRKSHNKNKERRKRFHPHTLTKRPSSISVKIKVCLSNHANIFIIDHHSLFLAVCLHGILRLLDDDDDEGK